MQNSGDNLHTKMQNSDDNGERKICNQKKTENGEG